jgi:hypothetical protein
LEFSMPIRVRWDVDFRGRVGRAKRIARRIREASPLFVELRIEGERGLSELPAVFAEIHKCNPRIEATVKLFVGAGDASRRGYPIDFIWEVGAREPSRTRRRTPTCPRSWKSSPKAAWTPCTSPTSMPSAPLRKKGTSRSTGLCTFRKRRNGSRP